jgi:kumamolisin
MQPILAANKDWWSTDVMQGSNGAYTAGKGWDACTGWGSPNGQAILKAMTAGAPAAAKAGSAA